MMQFALIILNFSFYLFVAIGIFNLLLIPMLKMDYKMLSIFLILSCLTEILLRELIFFQESNLIAIPVYSLIELIIFTIYFQFKKLSKYAYLVLLPMIACCYYEVFVYEYDELQTFFDFSRIISSLCIIIFTFIYLFKNIGTKLNYKLHFSIIAYYSVVFIHFMILNLLINIDDEIKFMQLNLYVVLTDLFYLILSYNLWKYGRNQE